MYAQVEKPKEKKSQSVANTVSQRQSSNAPTSRFVDNRPEAIQMRRLRDLAKNSPQNAKLRELHTLAAAHSVTQKKNNVKQGFGFMDNRPTSIAQQRVQEMANNHAVQQYQPIQMKDNVNINDEKLLKKSTALMRVNVPTSQFRVVNPSATQLKRNSFSSQISSQRMVIQRVGISAATSGKVNASPGQDRLDVPIEISKDDGTTSTITLNTSYKKHMIEAYTTGGIEITAAAAVQNTIAKLSEGDFQKAFEDFAFLLAKKLKGSDTDTFSPSAPANELTTNKGVSFYSDNSNLVAAVHAFPTVSAGNAVVLNQQEFSDLKLLTNTAYHTSGNLNGGAIAQASSALDRYKKSRNIDNLFSALQIASVGRLVRAKISASQKNNQELRDRNREAGILGAQVRRGEVRPVDCIVNGRPLVIE